MNKLEIKIPNDQEIDWEASAKQKQIVFKDKQLTYENVCDKLFAKGHYHTDEDGDIYFVDWSNDCPNNASTQHQLECILAKNKLANVARYLNGDWRPVLNETWYWLSVTNRNVITVDSWPMTYYTGKIYFKSSKLALQAIEILGEETVKLALEPLY